MVARALIVLVAALHLYFLALEMFLWRTPIGLKVFRMDAQKAETTAVLAANQGLYNGFLSAGLLWSLFSGAEFLPRATFFLACVVIAGLYGAATVGFKILYIQAVPALLALATLWLSR